MATVCPSTFFRVEIDASSSVKDCFGTASVLKSGWNSQWKVRQGGTYYHMQLHVSQRQIAIKGAIDTYSLSSVRLSTLSGGLRLRKIQPSGSKNVRGHTYDKL